MTTDPRHLLGGYATGNLTPEERRTLFAAALEDPELFEALADEEAFKDLLADPEAAARIRAALAPVVRPFWRRPVMLGSAAGLLFVASTTALLWRERPTPPASRKAAPLPKAAPVSPTAPQPAVPVPTDAGPRPEDRSASRILPPPPSPPSPHPAALAEAPEGAPRLFRAAPSEGSRKVQADLQAQVSKSLDGALGQPPTRAAEAEMAAPAASLEPAPQPRLSLRPQGRFLLEAPPSGTRHAYLLRRRGDAVDLLPLRIDPDTGWLRFEGSLAPGDQLDFYLLDRPSDTPAALPATGPVAGRRVRVYPTSP